MKITVDQIIDRMNLKKQVSKWRIISIILLLIIVIILTNNKVFKKVSYINGADYIARIKIDGIILNDLSRIEAIEALTKDSAIKGIILHINSPGGTVVGGENLYKTLRDVGKNIPLVTVMDDMATSAGYMTALSAEYIIAHRGTITGSIGVIAQSFEVVDLAKKLGIKFNTFKSSPLKGGPMPTEHLTPEMQKAMNETITDIYKMFLDIVIERRSIPLKKLLAIADGRVYTGQQAFELKLIDKVGSEKDAILWIKQKQNISSDIDVIDININSKSNGVNKYLNLFENLSSLLSLLTRNLSYFL